MEQTEDVKIVLGCYDAKPHEYHYQYIDDTWILSDIEPRFPTIKRIDARRIPYRGVAALYASHVLEHIAEDEVLETLAHWHAVLKDEGWVHINVPDMNWALNQLMRVNAGLPIESTYFTTRGQLMQIFNGTMDSEYDVHKSWFTKDKLKRLLQESGFDDVKVRTEFEAHDMQCVIAEAFKYED